MENKSITTNSIEHLLELLAQHGGTIESTGSLHVDEINNARASGRMYVDEHFLGYVWIPKFKSAFPTTEKEVELFEKYYPLPVEMPEHLKRPDWLFNKPNTTQIEQKEIYDFLLSRDKPFFVDTFRKLLNQFDKEEISMSKFVEVLNVTAYKWHKSKPNNEQEVQECDARNDATSTEAGQQNPSQLKEATILSAPEILKKHYDFDEGFTNYEKNCVLAAMEEYKNQEVQLLNK